VNREPRVWQARANPAGGRDLWPAAIVAIHALLFLTLAAWTWRKWPDPIVDFGRELYVPWQITRGHVLYRDIASLFGPLSPYLNAFWFRLFGVSLTTLVVCNLVIFTGVLAGVYRYVRLCADRMTAAAASLSTLLLFGFAHLVEIGNYNFVAPYSHEATHGLALSLVLLLCLARGVATREPTSWAIGGVCLGLVMLTKPETAVAAVVAVVAAISGASLLDPGHRRRLAWNAAVLVACAAVPPVLFFLYFLGRMAPADALRGTSGAWVPLMRAHLGANAFYLHGMGLDHPIANTLRMALTFLAFVIFVAVAAVISRVRTPGGASMLQRVQQVALVLVAVGFGQTGLIFYALPLATLTTLVWSVATFLGSRADRDRAVRLLWLAVWSAFALALLAKMGLNARIVHYGFYLGLPATVLTVVLIAWLLPEQIERWNGAGAARTFRTIALIGFAGAIAPYVTISATRYRERVVPIASGGDRFFASRPPEFWQGVAVQEALAELAHAPGSTLAVMPEGVMLNYLLRRDSPLRVVNLMPPELMTFSEDEIQRSLEAAPPDVVLLMHRDVREYGYPPFGTDPRYGQRILRWVRAHYREVKVIGHDPLSPQGFGIVIFERIS
jgi:hypothetical protein